MRRQHVLRDLQREGTVRLAVLEVHDFDVRELLREGFLEPLLTSHRGGRSRHVLDERNLALAAEHFPEGSGGRLTGLVVVACDERHKVVGIDSRVEDGDRDALPCCALDHADQRRGLGRCEDDAVNPRVDHRLDNLDLSGELSLCRRTLPLYCDAGIAGSLIGPGMDGTPELVGDRLGHNADPDGLGSVAAGRKRHQRDKGWEHRLVSHALFHHLSYKTCPASISRDLRVGRERALQRPAPRRSRTAARTAESLRISTSSPAATPSVRFSTSCLSMERINSSVADHSESEGRMWRWER